MDIEQLPVLLSYLMVVMALAISAAVTLKQMVRFYRAQAWVLTAVVLLTALDTGREATRDEQLAIGLLALLPATLAVVVPPLLARASLARATDGGQPERGRLGTRARLAALRDSLRDAPARADLTWLQHGHSRLSRGLSAVIEMILIATAVLVAYRLIRGTGAADVDAALNDEVTSLAVTLALLLQGLFTMGNKRDIIAQIIGLLVMEHGLFLAAVRIAPAELVLLFTMSLFFYALVTLTILLWILPELHRASSSIEVTDNSRLTG